MAARLPRVKQVLLERLPDWLTRDPSIYQPFVPHQRTCADLLETERSSKMTSSVHIGEIATLRLMILDQNPDRQ